MWKVSSVTVMHLLVGHWYIHYVVKHCRVCMGLFVINMGLWPLFTLSFTCHCSEETDKIAFQNVTLLSSWGSCLAEQSKSGRVVKMHDSYYVTMYTVHL